MAARGLPSKRPLFKTVFQDFIAVLVATKPGIFNETLGQFPAVFVLTEPGMHNIYQTNNRNFILSAVYQYL